MKHTKCLMESAILLGVAAVLSALPLVSLPYGGSVTLASLFPLLLLSYRHGFKWGLPAGIAFGVLQQLLGLSGLSYFTTWQSVVAVVALDYLLAFGAVGVGGVFRPLLRTQRGALVAGGALVCLLRYACHVISGATVWAGVSIPTKAALAYSLIYNATYMVPESIVLLLVAYYLGSVLDFRRETVVRMSGATTWGGRRRPLAAVGGFLLMAGLVFDTVWVFSHVQSAETGEFDLSLLAGNFSLWLPVLLVTASAVLLSVALSLVTKRRAE